MSKLGTKSLEVPEVEKMRHSASHVFAQAVLKFFPDAKLGIGPAIENGFYYDFGFTTPITEEDFSKIESEIKEIIKKDLPIHQEIMSRKEAINYFKKTGQDYKLNLLEDIPDKEISFFVTGEHEFADLCRGPHVESTGKVGAIKLDKLAGAYWRGDEKQPMLTRIYGLAFETQEELDKFIADREEAEKRDHRKLGPKLGLFMFSPIVGPGLPLLLPKGCMLKRNLENYIYKVKEKYGHKFVWTPHIARSALYIKSKHWQKYDAMMPALKIEDDEYTIKPMNCPHHFQIYAESPKSYRDLPLRMAENATVYRYERSGVLNGLLRVRSLTQDDSHWFMQHELIPQEIDRALTLMKEIYSDFGLTNYSAQISIRDKVDRAKYLGDDKVWDMAEKELVEATEKQGISYKVGEGDAAFYGPKIDLMARDSLGREWQLMTIQLDFVQPENFDLTYTDKDGQVKRPAILHIAILGSFERFMAILIEHFGGAFPMWIAPVQAKIITIADRHNEYALKISEIFQSNGFKVELDDRSEKLGAKIRDAEMEKVPYILVVGDKEIETESVSVRPRGRKDLGMINVENLMEMFKLEISSKGKTLVGNDDAGKTNDMVNVDVSSK